jgi:hypothetical protein
MSDHTITATVGEDGLVTVERPAAFDYGQLDHLPSQLSELIQKVVNSIPGLSPAEEDAMMATLYDGADEFVRRIPALLMHSLAAAHNIRIE